MIPQHARVSLLEITNDPNPAATRGHVCQNVIGSTSETGTAVSGRDEDHQIHPRSRRASEFRMRKRDQHLDTQYSAGNDDASQFQHCRKRYIISQQNTAAISNQSFSGTSQCLDRGSSSNPMT